MGATLLVLAIAWAVHRTESARVRETAFRTLAVVGTLKAAQLENWRWERQGDASVAAQFPAVVRAAISLTRGPRDAADVKTALRVLRTEADAYAYENALLFAPDGRVLFALHDSAARVGPTTLDLVKAARAASATVLSNFFRGRDDAVHVDVAQAVRDPAGRLIAILVLRTNADTHLYPILREFPSTPREAEVLLARTFGPMVVVLNSRRDSMAALPSAYMIPRSRARAVAVQAAQGHRGRVAGVSHLGEPVLADLRAVRGSPWLLITESDEAYIAASIGLADRLIGIGAVLALLAILTIGAYAERRREAMEFRQLYLREHVEREAEAVFRATLYSIGDAVITTDAEGRVAAMNRVAEELTGWTEGEVRGRALRHVYRAIDETTRASTAPTIPFVPTTVDPSVMTNHTLLIDRFGVERPVMNSTAPIVDTDRSLRGLVIVFRDQSALREQQGKLLQAEKLASMGRLAGGIAHDFNNILAAIRGAADLAAVAKDESWREDVSTIQFAAERATTLTRQLLTFSRQEVIRPTELDLQELTANMHRMLVRLLPPNIKFSVQEATGLDHVRVDRGQIEQVVLNLALNARDAMAACGTISVEMRNIETLERVLPTGTLAPGRYVSLAIADTGVGMDDATLRRIFEPFFTTKEAGKGTGLGLSTVYAIVQQNGGGIDVASAPGKGTTFTVYLPVAARSGSATEAPAQRG